MSMWSIWDFKLLSGGYLFAAGRRDALEDYVAHYYLSVFIWYLTYIHLFILNLIYAHRVLTNLVRSLYIYCYMHIIVTCSSTVSCTSIVTCTSTVTCTSIVTCIVTLIIIFYPLHLTKNIYGLKCSYMTYHGMPLGYNDCISKQCTQCREQLIV